MSRLFALTLVFMTTLSCSKSDCPKGTLAHKYKVPHEPETISVILQSIADGKNVSLKSEPRILSTEEGVSADGMRLFCVDWDLVRHDKVVDFVTCREVIQTETGAALGKKPILYAFDVNGNAHGDFAKFVTFFDTDADGDICDPEFIKAEKVAE